MIAPIGPTKLNLDLPVAEPPTLIEIALLCEDPGVDQSVSAHPPCDDQEAFLSEFERELVGNKLAELCQVGKVRMRTEGNWIVYEVTPEVCQMLLFLLLRHSTPRRRQTL